MRPNIFKTLTPKSLFWRGVWLIAVPIIVLIILLSVLIVQRYFDKVTGQLTAHVVREIETLEELPQDEFATALRSLGYRVKADARLERSQFDSLFDLSGRYIRSHLREDLDRDVDIISDGTKPVQIGFTSNGTDYIITVRRNWLTPINPHQILVNFMAFSALFLALALALLRNQVRSIKRLAEAARAFGRGDPSPHTPSGGLEVREAWNSFLIMRARIERQREQRGLMLSGISHDFRTPLTRLRLGAELLDEPEARDEMLGDIRELDEMIDSFLDYAANNATESNKTVRLNVFLEALIDRYENLRLVINDAPLSVEIKPQMMRRAIVNLLNNAERFGNMVEIDVTSDKNNVYITINDDGPGIPEAQRDNALKAFTRLDHSRNQNQGAHAGLGMAIAADIVRQHGGSMTLDQSHLGGLAVRIRLPRA